MEITEEQIRAYLVLIGWKEDLPRMHKRYLESQVTEQALREVIALNWI